MLILYLEICFIIRGVVLLVVIWGTLDIKVSKHVYSYIVKHLKEGKASASQ